MIHWPLILIAYLSLFALGLMDNIRGPLYPELLTEFKITHTQGAYFFIVTSLVSFFASFITQYYINRRGSMWVMRTGLILMTLGGLGIAYLQNFGSLLLASACLGFGFGHVQVAQNILVIEASPNRYLSRLLSGLHSFYGLASLLAPLIVCGSIYCRLNWHANFYFVSLAPLLLLLGSLKVKNQTHQIQTQAEVKAKNTLKEILYAFMISFYVAAEIAISTRLALLIREVFAGSAVQASLAVSFFFMLMLAGRLLFSFTSLGMRTRQVMWTSLIISFACFVLGLWTHPVFLCLCGFTMAPFYPMAVSDCSEVFQSQTRRVIAYTQAFSSLFVVSMHALVGFLSDLCGIKWALHIGIADLLLAMLLLCFLNKKRAAL